MTVEAGETGMSDFELARRNMVESQVRTNNVTDRRLIAAMLEIPRERFVAPTIRELAYIDEDVPFAESGPGRHRWLMEPMPFARLVQLAGVRPEDLVLDVGCGTGYSTAVLARLGESAVGLECEAELAARADQLLIELGIGNAAVLTGELSAGCPRQAPFDVIVLEGAVEVVPEALLRQLRDGGRLVAPVMHGPIGKATLFTKSGGEISSRVDFDINVQPLPGFRKAVEFVF